MAIARIDVLLRTGRGAALELRAQLEHVAHALHVERAVLLETFQRRIVGLRGDILRQLEPLGEQSDRFGLVLRLEHPA